MVIVVGASGLIPGSLTPPDKVIGASGDLSGYLLNHYHHLQQEGAQQQQHHNPYALTHPSSAMAPSLQTLVSAFHSIATCAHRSIWLFSKKFV